MKRGKGFGIQILLNTLLGVLNVSLGLAFVGVTKLTIDVATRQGNSFTLHQGVLLLCLLMAMQILVGFAARWVKAVWGIRAQNRMQQLLFAHLLNSEWSSLRQYHTGDILNRLQKDVAALVALLTEDLPTFITTLVQFLGAFFLLFHLDEQLALIVAFIAPLFLFISKLYVRKLRALTHEVRESDSRVQSILQESLQHALVIKILAKGSYMLERLQRAHNDLSRNVVTKTKYSSFSATLMNLGFAAGYLFTFIWGIFSLQAGTIGYGSLIAFIQLVGQIQGPVRTLAKYVPLFINATTACERLIALENLPVEDAKATVQSSLASANAALKISPIQKPTLLPPPTLRFSEVSFRYTPTARPILQRFSHDFPPASITAVLGETGSGKTTLVRCMLALVRPQRGSIGFLQPDGTFSPLGVDHRQRFAYVPQGNTLLSGTIRENLLLGNPTASEAQMLEALHVAGADFVAELPDRLNTSCTEMGGGLSEGQAQRICIARALLCPADIFLFDESTSALDAATEEQVIERIVAHCLGRTLIFVTHRPAVLKHATHRLFLHRHTPEGENDKDEEKGHNALESSKMQS